MTHTISSFEDLKALEGQELGVSDWYDINQEQINQFADATHDHQWIHVDEDRAKAEICLLYTSPSPRDISGSRMPSSA